MINEKKIAVMCLFFIKIVFIVFAWRLAAVSIKWLKISSKKMAYELAVLKKEEIRGK